MVPWCNSRPPVCLSLSRTLAFPCHQSLSSSSPLLSSSSSLTFPLLPVLCYSLFCLVLFCFTVLVFLSFSSCSSIHCFVLFHSYFPILLFLPFSSLLSSIHLFSCPHFPFVLSLCLYLPYPDFTSFLLPSSFIFNLPPIFSRIICFSSPPIILNNCLRSSHSQHPFCSFCSYPPHSFFTSFLPSSFILNLSPISSFLTLSLPHFFFPFLSSSISPISLFLDPPLPHFFLLLLLSSISLSLSYFFISYCFSPSILLITPSIPPIPIPLFRSPVAPSSPSPSRLPSWSSPLAGSHSISPLNVPMYIVSFLPLPPLHDSCGYPFASHKYQKCHCWGEEAGVILATRGTFPWLSRSMGSQ